MKPAIRRKRKPWFHFASWMLVACVHLGLAGRALALDPSRQLTQYNCQTWNRQNGLLVNSVNAIAQTSDGYLWLGTSAGLMRFDGAEFSSVHLPQPTKSVVNCLEIGRTGGLWVGLEHHNFTFYDGQSFSLNGTGLPANAGANNLSLQEDQAGTLWIVAQNQLARFTASGSYEVLATLPEIANCGFRDSHGRLWYGTAENGVFYWQAGMVHKLADAALSFAITEDHAGNIWIGTATGLLCYDASLHQKSIPSFGVEVRCLFVDRQDVLWIGTSHEGLSRYYQGQYSYLKKSDGLAFDYVKSIAEDREGSLWIGTRNGVSQLTDVKFPTRMASENSSAPDALSVAASSLGGIWVGSIAGVSYLNDTIKTYGAESGLTNSIVKRVLEAANGDLYLVNGSKDLAIFSKGKVVARYSATNMIVGMVEDAQGVVVSAGGQLYRAGTNYFTPYPFAGDNAPPLYWVLNLAPGRDGEIWVACINGIARIKDGSFQQWTTAQGLTDGRVGWVCEDSDGVVWAATSSGIARLRQNQIKCISTDNGLFDNNVFAIVPDDLGNLWVDSERGIFRVSRESMNNFADGETARVECTPYDGLESVKPADKTFQEQVGCKSLDGRIWFPGANGVVMIDPRQIPTNTIVPPVRIQNIRANGRAYPRSAAVVVPPGGGELEFDFAALSFIAPQKVQYRYRLAGFDHDWVDAKFRRQAFYTNLKPGRYTFTVIAANADGIWNSKGDTTGIELQPHYYQTGWFYSGCGGVILGALVWGYRRHTRRVEYEQHQLQAARDRLEAEVHLRTAELAHERDLLQALLENSPDYIYFKDAKSRFIKSSNANAKKFGAASAGELAGKSDFDFFSDEHARPAYEEEQNIIRTGQPVIGKIERETYHDKRRDSWALTTKMPYRNRKGEIIGTFGISKDITPIIEAEARLKEVHKQLLATSRKAGMAEVATNVLHNVGNVLNSVNVSAVLLLENLQKSKAPGLAKVVALLKENAADLGTYITTNLKGRQVPGYLHQLSVELAREQQDALKELELLRQNIEHIKEIVAMQQTYAKISGVTETIHLPDLVEDALAMNANRQEKHEVELIREYTEVPPVTIEKHKLLQILVNLFRNARHACADSGRPDKKIWVRISQQDRRVIIAVKDNGIGIPQENLTRIFNHGFTTRIGGHGFGLHSGALAARELGGSLTVASEGAGQGATFNLNLPLQPPKSEG